MAAAESGVENPLATKGDESPPNAGTETEVAATRNERIDIKAGLRDGTLTSDEAIVLMEEQL
eukprot:COSAG04_NODE_18617_length_436_cov_1.649852_1_plen_61_part_10